MWKTERPGGAHRPLPGSNGQRGRLHRNGARRKRLTDAIARAGGFRISDGFISPLDLVEIGLMSAEEAKELHDMETAAAAG
jgi:hypothetical protein